MDDSKIGERIKEYRRGKPLLFDDIDVGMEFPTIEFKITKELVETYCDAMEDSNLIFRDEMAAISEGFDGTIAPPTIVCIYAIPSALLSGFKPKVIPPPGNIHYRQEYEFLNTAYIGDIIRLKSVVTSKEIRKGRKYVTIESEYLNQDDVKIAVGRITPVWSR